MPLDACPSLTTDTYPADLQERPQWLTWKATDGRKIPRAPYAHSGEHDRFVDAQNPSTWTDFATASEWVDKLPEFALAYLIRDREDYPGEDLVFVDYDDVRDPESGAIHPTVREHVERADSYADVSTSGTGVHILCRGGLPEGVGTITDELPPAEDFPDAEIEVYDSARFVAMTGRHLAATPGETTPSQSFVDMLADAFATVTASRPPELRDEPVRPKDDLATTATTTDIQDVYDAIAQTRPADIRLDSTVTEERRDGSRSLDPSWTHSTSGTRLAQTDDRWIYRDGMISLDALQVVALEAGLINDERSYPSGSTFWRAVDTLRDRGARIPEFEPEREAVAEPTADAPSGAPGMSPTTARELPRWGSGADGATEGSSPSTGSATLDHEVALLRETVAEQAERIGDLETLLAKREATIASLRARMVELGGDEGADGDPECGGEPGGRSTDSAKGSLIDQGGDGSGRTTPWRRLRNWIR